MSNKESRKGFACLIIAILLGAFYLGVSIPYWLAHGWNGEPITAAFGLGILQTWIDKLTELTHLDLTYAMVFWHLIAVGAGVLFTALGAALTMPILTFFGMAGFLAGAALYPLNGILILVCVLFVLIGLIRMSGNK